MNSEQRSEQQWGRAVLALAVYKLAADYYSGQDSKGYAKLCQADRVLAGVQFRAGAGGYPLDEEDVRSTAAAYLWAHRRDVARNW